MKYSEAIAARKDEVIRDVKITSLVLIASCILPVVFHLFPYYGGVPIGAVWLPIFYAPLLGIILFRPHMGIIAGILAPMINAAITGRPDASMVLMLTLDMFLFTIICSVLYKKWHAFILAAPLAYILAKFSSCVLLGVFPLFIEGAGCLEVFFMSLKMALPGIIMLFLLNIAGVLYQKRSSR